MKTTNQCLKNHFNLAEREVLVPLLDAHVVYLCRVIKSIPSFSAKIGQFHSKIAGWYAQDYPECPEVAINKIFGVQVATHNNVLGQEAQYYQAQFALSGRLFRGSPQGVDRPRRVRYLWAAINAILAEDSTLSAYTPYSEKVLVLRADCVVCPICGEAVATWTEDDYIRTPCHHLMAEFDGGNRWCVPEVDNVIDRYEFFEENTYLFEVVNAHDCEYWFASQPVAVENAAELFASAAAICCPICRKLVLRTEYGRSYTSPCEHTVKLVFDDEIEFRQDESLWEEQGFDIEATCKGKMHKVAEFCEGFFFEEDEDEDDY